MMPSNFRTIDTQEIGRCVERIYWDDYFLQGQMMYVGHLWIGYKKDIDAIFGRMATDVVNNQPF